MLINRQTNLLEIIFFECREKFKTIFVRTNLQILQSEN